MADKIINDFTVLFKTKLDEKSKQEVGKNLKGLLENAVIGFDEAETKKNLVPIIRMVQKLFDKAEMKFDADELIGMPSRDALQKVADITADEFQAAFDRALAKSGGVKIDFGDIDLSAMTEPLERVAEELSEISRKIANDTKKSVDEIEQSIHRLNKVKPKKINTKVLIDGVEQEVKEEVRKVEQVVDGIEKTLNEINKPKNLTTEKGAMRALEKARDKYAESVANDDPWEIQYQHMVSFVSKYEAMTKRIKPLVDTNHPEFKQLYDILSPKAGAAKISLEHFVDVARGNELSEYKNQPWARESTLKKVEQVLRNGITVKDGGDGSGDVDPPKEPPIPSNSRDGDNNKLNTKVPHDDTGESDAERAAKQEAERRRIEAERAAEATRKAAEAERALAEARKVSAKVVYRVVYPPLDEEDLSRDERKSQYGGAEIWTSSPDVADTYATGEEDPVKLKGSISAKNAYIIDAKGATWKDFDKMKVLSPDGVDKNGKVKFSESSLRDAFPELFARIDNKEFGYEEDIQSEIYKLIHSLGYDSVITRNVVDAKDIDYYKEPSTIYAVFDDSALKVLGASVVEDQDKDGVTTFEEKYSRENIPEFYKMPEVSDIVAETQSAKASLEELYNNGSEAAKKAIQDLATANNKLKEFDQMVATNPESRNQFIPLSEEEKANFLNVAKEYQNTIKQINDLEVVAETEDDKQRLIDLKTEAIKLHKVLAQALIRDGNIDNYIKEYGLYRDQAEKFYRSIQDSTPKKFIEQIRQEYRANYDDSFDRMEQLNPEFRQQMFKDMSELEALMDKLDATQENLNRVESYIDAPPSAAHEIDATPIDTSAERTQLTSVRSSVDDVTAAVNTKTEAFKAESIEVDKAVDGEIAKIGELENKLTAVKTTLEGLLSNIKSDACDIGTGLSNITVNVNHQNDENVKIDIPALTEAISKIQVTPDNEGLIAEIKALTASLGSLIAQEDTLQAIKGVLETKDNHVAEKIPPEIKAETSTNRERRFERLNDIASLYEDVEDVDAAIKEFGELYKEIVLIGENATKVIKPNKTGINTLKKIANGDIDLGYDYSWAEFKRNTPQPSGVAESTSTMAVDTEALRRLLDSIIYNVKIVHDDSDKTANKIALDESALEGTLQRVFANVLKPSVVEADDSGAKILNVLNNIVDKFGTRIAQDETLQTISGEISKLKPDVGIVDVEHNSAEIDTGINTNGVKAETDVLIEQYRGILRTIEEWRVLYQKLQALPAGHTAQEVRKNVLSALQDISPELARMIGSKFAENFANGFKGIKTKDIVAQVSQISNVDMLGSATEQINMLKDIDFDNFNFNELPINETNIEFLREAFELLQKISEKKKEISGVDTSVDVDTEMDGTEQKNEPWALEKTLLSVKEVLGQIQTNTAKPDSVEITPTNTDVGNVLATENTLAAIKTAVESINTKVVKGTKAKTSEGGGRKKTGVGKKNAEDYAGSQYFPEKLKTQTMYLAKFRATLMTTGKLTDDVDAQIYELLDGLSKIQNGPDLSRWNQQFLQLKTSVGIEDIFEKAEDKVATASYEELIELQRTRNKLELQYEKAQDGSPLKQFYAEQLLQMDQTIAKQQTILDNEEYELKLAKMREEQARKLGEVEAKTATKDAKKQAAEDKRQAKRNAMFGKAGNAIGRAENLWMSAQGEDEPLPPTLSKQVDELYDKMVALRAEQDKVRTAETVTEEQQADLRNHTIEVNQLTNEVSELFAEYQKLSGSNVDETKTQATTLNNKSPLSAYENELKQYVKSITHGNAQIKSFDATTKTLTYTVKTGKNEFTEYTAAVRRADSALVSLQGATKRTETFIEATMRKMKEISSYMSGMSLISRLGQELRRGIQYVREIDLALTELKKVTNETEETYDRFLDTAAKTAEKVGSTIQKVVSSTADWARLNI